MLGVVPRIDSRRETRWQVIRFLLLSQLLGSLDLLGVLQTARNLPSSGLRFASALRLLGRRLAASPSSDALVLAVVLRI